MSWSILQSFRATSGLWFKWWILVCCCEASELLLAHNILVDQLGLLNPFHFSLSLPWDNYWLLLCKANKTGTPRQDHLYMGALERLGRPLEDVTERQVVYVVFPEFVLFSADIRSPCLKNLLDLWRKSCLMETWQTWRMNGTSPASYPFIN